MPFTVFVLFFIILCGNSSSLARVRRTGAVQDFGTVRKVEAMYFQDNGKYTDNVLDFSKYTNITNTFNLLENKKVNINLSKNKMQYTATATAIFHECRYFLTATPEISQFKLSEDCEKKQKTKKTLQGLLILGLYALLFYAVYRSDKNQNQSIKISNSIIISLFISIMIFVILYITILQSYWGIGIHDRF